jgi:K+/H+ antiporter YhaU regulatory subunit KhtT
VLQPGDRLVVIGRQEDLTGFRRHVIDADRG